MPSLRHRITNRGPTRPRATAYLAAILLPLASLHGTLVRIPACDCEIPSPHEALAQGAAVFSGKVVAVVERDSTVDAFVDVLEIWKGEFSENMLARVVTPDNDATCGFPFRVGEEVVIFAEPPSDVLRTTICTPTGMLSRSEATNALGPPVEINPLNVEFRRGDVDGDGEINITDAVDTLLLLFQGRFDPPCSEALDYENDGSVEITDAIASLTYQFLGGPVPGEPFPHCGKDPELLPFEPFDCERYPLCPPQTETHEIVRVERVGGEMEIELFSTRPFIPRALAPILCIGTQSFTRARSREDGDWNTLIFTLTPEEFEGIQDASLVTVQHGDRCFLDLAQQVLYWSLWVFGPLETL